MNAQLLTTNLGLASADPTQCVLLGEWCRADGQDLAERFRVLPFHWDDFEKRGRDYEYLRTLHRTLAAALVPALNDLHRIQYDQQSWQLVFDPWLVCWLGTLFDRWESLRLASQKGNFRVAMHGLPPPPLPLGVNAFELRSSSHPWNQWLYEDLVEGPFAGEFQQIRDASSSASEDVWAQFRGANSRRGRFVRWVWPRRGNRLGELCLTDTCFTPSLMARFSFAMRRPPRVIVHSRPFLGAIRPIDVRFREGIRVDWRPSNAFEVYLSHRLTLDLPTAAVEGFGQLREGARTLGVQTGTILTAFGYWADPQSKAWIAESVAEGARVLLMDHGGSLKVRDNVLGIEDVLVDGRLTWSTPETPSQLQVPSTKLAPLVPPPRYETKDSRRKDLLLVGTEFPPFVFRPRLGPSGPQFTRAVRQWRDFAASLEPCPRQALRLRPHPVSQGWAVPERVRDFLDVGRVESNGRLSEALRRSRFVICSYPETTLAEALARSIPTIVMFSKDSYEFTAPAQRMLNMMLACGMAFYDPQAAAEHVNAVWAEPLRWWDSSAVRDARDRFLREALGQAPNWGSTWRSGIEALETRIESR